MIRTIKAIAAAFVVVAAFTGCGSTTNTGQGSSPSPSTESASSAPTTQASTPETPTTHASATQPSNDQAGYIAAVTGPEYQAFRDQLDKTAKAMAAGKITESEQESRILIEKADAYLAVIDTTNPPPQLQGSKEHLINGVTQVRMAGQDVISGLQNADTATLDEASGHMTSGTDQFQQAVDELPSS